MLIRSLALAIFSTALTLPAAAGASAVPGYTIAGIGTLPGYTSSSAVAINNSGTVVGQVCCGSWPALPNTQAVIYRGRVLSGLDSLTGGVPGYFSNTATAVNNRGVVVGWTYYITGSATCDVDIAVAFAAGSVNQFGSLGGCPQFSANGVNDRGAVVGHGASSEFLTYDDAVLFDGSNVIVLGTGTANAINNFGFVAGTDAAGVATLYTRTSSHEIGTLGGSSSAAVAINNVGTVVGVSSVAGSTLDRAFAFRQNRFTNLGVPIGTDPNSTSSSALGVNDLDEIVGSYDAGGSQRAFVDIDGGMRDLTALLPVGSGWTLTTAASINACGEIAGTGVYRGATYGFVLRPVQHDRPADRVRAGCEELRR